MQAEATQLPEQRRHVQRRPRVGQKRPAELLLLLRELALHCVCVDVCCVRVRVYVCEKKKGGGGDGLAPHMCLAKSWGRNKI